MELTEQEMVGHAGDVIADDAVARLAQGELSVLRRHTLGVLEIKREKRVERGYRAVAVFDDRWLRIEPGEEEAFQVAVQLGHGW